MTNQALIIARKELLDSMRDLRSMLSSILYCLMGPAVVFMVSLTMSRSPNDNERLVLGGMMSIFTLVSAFTGGMNVSMDVLAGERERRSLLPLLMNGVARRNIVAGKWLAISCLSAVGVAISLAGFAAVFARLGMLSNLNKGYLLMMTVSSIIPLALFAAATELAVSTACKTLKEAHTYLSMLAFLPMLTGMFLVFNPNAAQGWTRFMPLAGQQWQLEQWLNGSGATFAQPVILFILTCALAALAALAAAKLLEHDGIVYGD